MNMPFINHHDGFVTYRHNYIIYFILSQKVSSCHQNLSLSAGLAQTTQRSRWLVLSSLPASSLLPELLKSS